MGSNKVQTLRCIIGLTGSFGSGCTYLAQNILKTMGYRLLSLSQDSLKPIFHEKKGKDPDKVPRQELQEFGDNIRQSEGAGFFAEQIAGKIESDKGQNKWVVDSIRNPAEVRVLREFSRNFFLFGVYADKELRWKRVKSIYGNNRHHFDVDDHNDTGEENEPHEQRVGDCFYEADVVLTNGEDFATPGNEKFKAFAGDVKNYIDLVERPLAKQQPIRKDEGLMAMAYAISQQSSCLKRKVGAIITDAEGNVISSGYNEVPRYERPCRDEYNGCYRDWLTDDLVKTLADQFSLVEGQKEDLRNILRKKARMLDNCRALHAEENAIVNLARNGPSVPMEKCVLYTTTYPCRMCANKIVNVNLKNIVYIEPYPDEQAKAILKNAGVNDRFFKGVTFKAYSRLYGEEK